MVPKIEKGLFYQETDHIKILYGIVRSVKYRVLYPALYRRIKFARLLLAAVLPVFLALSCATNFAAIQAEMPDISGKANGTYRGEYDLPKAPVDVTLDVRLENARITGIDIVRHFCSPIGKKAEKITERIIEKQSLDVDVITGATGSSKAILKAVEDALK